MSRLAVGDWPEPLVIDLAPAPLSGLDPDEAWFNESRTHRYLLTRRWGSGEPMTVIGLNPSTADAFTDDPTIRRVVRFARREGCGWVRMLNIYGLRATNPRRLREHPEPAGLSADAILAEYARGLVVVAWGAGGALNGRGASAAGLLFAAGVTPVCLGVTAGGQPRHPLYVRADAPLTPWRPVPDLRDSPVSTPPGRGLNAAADPSPAAAAPGIPPSPPRDARGTTEEPTGGADHPSVPLVASSAPGRPPVPGAERGQVEPPLMAPARTALAGTPGGQGTSSRTGQREGNAGPGATTSGPALTSSPDSEGISGGAREGEAGDQTPGASLPPAHEPAGGTRSGNQSSTSPPAVPPSGEKFRRQWQAARSADAKAARNRRGKPPAKRTGGGYVPGGNRRTPPGGTT